MKSSSAGVGFGPVVECVVDGFDRQKRNVSKVVVVVVALAVVTVTTAVWCIVLAVVAGAAALRAFPIGVVDSVKVHALYV